MTTLERRIVCHSPFLSPRSETSRRIFMVVRCPGLLRGILLLAFLVWYFSNLEQVFAFAETLFSSGLGVWLSLAVGFVLRGILLVLAAILFAPLAYHVALGVFAVIRNTVRIFRMLLQHL